MKVSYDKMSEHIKYEIDMLRWAVKEIKRLKPSLQWNAAIESFAAHVRILIDFFYTSKAKRDEAIAEHFISNWRIICPKITRGLKEAKIKANNQLAHLTYSRATRYGVTEEKGWQIDQISDDFEKVIKLFHESLPNKKIAVVEGEKGTMIKYYKLLNPYKGITKPIKLENLGEVNIICGKNNSGKSSILECFLQKDKCVIGRLIDEDSMPWWKTTIEKACRGFQSPPPHILQQWMLGLIESKKGFIIYEDELPEIDTNFNNTKPNGTPLELRHLTHIYNFQPMLKEYLSQLKNEFFPVLLPPKRTLELNALLSQPSQIHPSGRGIISKLFDLKNKAINGKERAIFDRLSKAFNEITSGYNFDIHTLSNNSIAIYFSNDSKQWIPGEATGLGMCDLLVILYFIIASDNKIILIEEAESHIHPDMQRKLLSYIASCKDKQFIISTHSNVFLDTSYTDKIIFTEKTDTVHAYDETEKSQILEGLGYSIIDNLVSDLIILTEGPSDRGVIEEICRKIGFWDKYNIKLWPLGGDIMDQIDLSVLKEKSNIIALIDSDPKSKHTIRNAFKEKCKKEGIPVTQLKRYAIENYFSVPALKKVFGEQLPTEITEIKPDMKIDDQIGFTPKKSGREIIRNMDLSELKDTDLLAFCQNIEEHAKKGSLKTT